MEKKCGRSEWSENIRDREKTRAKREAIIILRRLDQKVRKVVQIREKRSV